MDNDDVFVTVNPNIDAGDERFLELRDFFIKEFSCKPEFLTRVPGRVNLIGEHVDYNGYGVVPMAISQNILLAVSNTTQGDDIIHIKNIQSSKFKGHKCSIDHLQIEPPKAGTYPHWYNYVLCGVKGIVDYLQKIGDYRRKGFFIAVSGNIPPASGLSSSSALVCSAALATAYLFNLPLNKNLLATLSASSERFIGTQGGGMDQAIAFLAKKGCAQFIEFNPIRATAISLPSDAVFVIANSLSEANKAATSDFNTRVVECRIACKLLAHLKGFAWEKVTNLSQLQNEMFNIGLEQFELLIKENLTKDKYTKDELLELFQMSSSQFEENFLTANTKHVKEFKLRQRSLHVVQESIRVERFCETSANADDDDDEDAIDKLSSLMCQSHQSLDTLYECSHPNLDKLVDLSEELGVGARLTGAGWGGCCVALTDSISKCDSYITALKKSYYSHIPHVKNMNLDDVVFATEPQNGAEIFIAEFY